jgi:V/A-type H+-transporting ATPase subunit I
MFLPESMSRIVIVGSNSCIDETIDVLYDLEAVHLIDHTVDADEGFTLGTPRPYSPKTAERLLKVRAMEKDLGINKHTKTQPISESEIRSQITSDGVENVESEVRVVLDKRNDLNQRITELNAKKKSLELLSRLPIDLDMYSGYKSIVSIVGSVEKDPTQALAGLGEVFYSPDKKNGNLVAVFVKNEDKSKAQSILSENGFSEISVPEGTGPVNEALMSVNNQLDTYNKELEVIQKETEVLFERYKHFLRASDEELTMDAEKGTLPIRIATTKYTFVIDAWVPTPKVESVKSTIESKVIGTYVEIEENRGRREAEADNVEDRFKTVPTKMTHGRITKHFEYPTKMMSVPKYQEVDPTTLIAIFLPIFFGLMVGDVGYAIPFIILGAYGLKFAKNPDWRAIATVLFFGGIWAAIFGFFFFGEALGMHFVGEPEGVEYTWQSLLGLENLDKAFSWLADGHGVHKIGAAYVGFLLKLSVYIGLVHLTIGYLLAIYNKSIQYGFKHGFMEKGGAFLTFAGLVIVCYAVATNLVTSSPLPNDLYLGFIGVGAVIMIIGLIINAKEEGVMKVVIELPDTVGNILSYTRLVAIGMSKAGMALAFNYIAIGMIAGGIGGIPGIIVGFVAFTFFQLMIWTLAIMSAGLHALRLQLVEFMIRFYEGDGIEFTPLKIKRNKLLSNKNVKEA